MSSIYEESRRTSFNYSSDSSGRRPSLKEMPSFRDEASRALNRREDLAKLKERLSFNRDILHADPSSKPWLRKTSVPIRENSSGSLGSPTSAAPAYQSLQQVKEDASMAYSISGNYSLHTASPAMTNDGLESPSMMSNGATRPRNLSRGTSASFDSSNDGSYYEY